jgi:hypothetical protein
VLAVAVLLAGVVGLLVQRSVAPPRPAPRPTAVPVSAPAGEAMEAAAVLRAWDAARAKAWADGSVPALRRLYVGGAGERDVGLLRDYRRRGLTVDGLRMQVLGLDVLRHRPGEWRLRVTDRVAAGVVTDRDGRRRPLPRDQATTREVVLVRGDGGWRVSEVVLLES